MQEAIYITFDQWIVAIMPRLCDKEIKREDSDYIVTEKHQKPHNGHKERPSTFPE